MHLTDSVRRVRSCYSYGGDRKWTKLANLTTPRQSSSSVPIPGGIWVTGGSPDESKRLKTTEEMFLNKTKQAGPTLPATRTDHCLVKYGDKIFSTGGYDENVEATSNVWQFNAGDNFANSDGEVMKETRAWHGCGIVHSIHHRSRPLIVVAGSASFGGGTGTKNSEFWDFTVPGSPWQRCSKSCYFSLIIHYFENNIQIFEYEILYIYIEHQKL